MHAHGRHAVSTWVQLLAVESHRAHRSISVAPYCTAAAMRWPTQNSDGWGCSTPPIVSRTKDEVTGRAELRAYVIAAERAEADAVASDRKVQLVQVQLLATTRISVRQLPQRQNAMPSRPMDTPCCCPCLGDRQLRRSDRRQANRGVES